MDKAQAINSLWNDFKLKAYDENSVPDNAEFPYITYNVITDSLDNIVTLNGSLWYKSSSWKDISLKADEISEYLKGGVCIKLNTGYLYAYRGTPFAQRMSDESDDTIRRIYITINAEFLTNM